MSAHVIKGNGRFSSPFPHPQEGPFAQLCGKFARMDGDRLFAYSLSVLSGRSTLEDAAAGASESEEYIQCAGSAEGLTVELRCREGDEFVQSVLGRADEPSGGDRVEIRWESNRTEVARREVWDPEAAARLFVEYFETGSVGEHCSRRVIFRGPAS